LFKDVTWFPKDVTCLFKDVTWFSKDVTCSFKDDICLGQEVTSFIKRCHMVSKKGNVLVFVVNVRQFSAKSCLSDLRGMETMASTIK
jgi:hypothetical protein